MDGTDSPPARFTDPDRTATGETRASVRWRGLKTLWLNTGTLCNIECANCYIESSPTNDALVYLTLADVTPLLDEIDSGGNGPVEIGITGGEPFMCPQIIEIMQACLARGHDLLVLTNAMQPMMRARIRGGLLDLLRAYGAQMTLRVSLDHFTASGHDRERGAGSFEIALKGLDWLSQNGFQISLAGRRQLVEDETRARQGYRQMIARAGLAVDPEDPGQLVLFPEMTADDNPPEITTACWGILGRDPGDIMCASQRMLVRRKGANRAVITACTLLAHPPKFELGTTLAEATREPVRLNHPWCSSFCVLGGSSCSG